MQRLKRFSGVAPGALVAGLLAIALAGCATEEAVGADVATENRPFTSEVEDVLQTKMNTVTNEVAAAPRIISLVRDSNERNKDTPLSEIEQIDERWKAIKGMDAFIKAFISNETSQILLEFQDAHRGYPEIFIADAKGLIVGLTNKTSDYYQADEDWWVQGFNDGDGKAFHGEIEYDESALSEAIPLYSPIIDPATGRAIGVMKVIVDITSIKMEL